MRKPTDAISQIRWLHTSNAAGMEIPAFGLVRVTGATDGVLTGARPNADSQDVFVNGPVAIPDTDTGLITRDDVVYALYDSGDGTPAAGEQWGAGTNSFKLRKNKTGFRIVGGTDTANTRVLVRRDAGGGSDIGCRIKHSTTQTVSASSSAKLAFDSEDYDTDTMHDSGSNTRITIQTAGKYLVWFGFKADVEEGGDSFLEAFLFKNGSATLHADIRRPVTAGSYAQLSLTIEDTYAANDYLEVQLENGDAGASCTVSAQFFGARKIDKAG